jgi:hypothetical protein
MYFIPLSFFSILLLKSTEWTLGVIFALFIAILNQPVTLQSVLSPPNTFGAAVILFSKEKERLIRNTVILKNR